MTRISSDSRTYVLQHQDGTTVTIHKDKAEWEKWDHKRWTEDLPLWHPSAYAAKLVRLGFHRKEADQCSAL